MTKGTVCYEKSINTSERLTLLTSNQYVNWHKNIVKESVHLKERQGMIKG